MTGIYVNSIKDKTGSRQLASDSGSAWSWGSGIPTGTVIKKSFYSIGRGTFTNSDFPSDDTIPQRSQGTEIFSQAYTPSTTNCNLILTATVRLGESSDMGNTMNCALFISDADNALCISEDYAEGASNKHSGNLLILYKMSSWGESEKTFSLRASGANRYNYSTHNTSYATEKWGGVLTSAFIVEEIAS